jgi:uncharacterized membrane protein YbhN (UPF0104 family)
MALAHFKPVAVGPAVRRTGPPLLRLIGALVVLMLLGRHLGAAPFRDGLRAVNLPAVGIAIAITALTTVCSAWRWGVVAGALGVGIDRPAAVGAYYRSQFLNSVLPGGIVGDVHRAVGHGRRAGAVGGGLRAVACERLAGQLVQVVLTVIALFLVPSPLRPWLPVLLAGLAGAASCVALGVIVAARRGGSRLARAARTVAGDLRRGVLARDVWPRVTLASAVAVAGYTTVFVVAARAVGATAPVGELVALAMLVHTAMAIPLSIGGWGLREGAAAWAFAASGLGAGTGVAATTVFGVLSLAAVSPGACLLLRDGVRRIRRNRVVGTAANRSGEPVNSAHAYATLERVHD